MALASLSLLATEYGYGYVSFIIMMYVPFAMIHMFALLLHINYCLSAQNVSKLKPFDFSK